MSDAGVRALRLQAAGLALPAAAAQALDVALGHLEEAGPLAPDRAVTVAWAEMVLALPWHARPRPPVDLGALRAALDAAHLGQERGKERILEAAAALRLSPGAAPAALLLEGPPGTGKSALPVTLAQALGRPLVTLSLAGVEDAADLYGTPRLVPGAQAGRLLEAVRAAGAADPVVLVEGLDAFALAHEGEAEDLLMPLLDPAQRRRFQDRWLGLPLDLSGALVVGTAYSGDLLPAALQERLQNVPLRGYTDPEKRAVAQTHLLPRLVAEVGLPAGSVHVRDEVLQALIDGWTFETGVNDLERGLLALLRRTALRAAEGLPAPYQVEEDDLNLVLGPRHHRREKIARMGVPGVAMGLAWTPAGGQVLFIEASVVPGRGALKLTGSLGEVMKESAEAALTWLREHTVHNALLPEVDVHVHVPEGGIPKDGPSAGLTLLVALASAISGRVPRHDVALTGEITLRGLVLPVGGIREKLLAAQRAGARAVILPRANADDLADIAPEALATLRIYLVERIEEALELALVLPAAAAPRRPRPKRAPAPRGRSKRAPRRRPR